MGGRLSGCILQLGVAQVAREDGEELDEAVEDQRIVGPNPQSRQSARWQRRHRVGCAQHAINRGAHVVGLVSHGETLRRRKPRPTVLRRLVDRA